MTRPRGGSAPRPQARSAGMAERPMRNESLVDLVRFFQTQNAPAEPATALPTPESRDLKPFHRRLLHFTQRQKKDTSPKSKSDESQRQIEALQREGYLLGLPKSPPKSLPKSKGSLDRSFSKSKRQDVESIGQPWLENKDDGKQRAEERRRRLASLDLGDFGSIMDVAGPLSIFDDSMPPPYQPSAQYGVAPGAGLTPEAQSSSTASAPSTDPTLQVPSKPALPLPSTGPALETETPDVHRAASSANSSTRVVPKEATGGQQARENSTPELPDTAASNAVNQEEDISQPGDIGKSSEIQQPSPAPQPSSAPAPPALKLFPNVAPPRVSSKHAWRISATPRYRTPSGTTSATGPVVRVKSSHAKGEPTDGNSTMATAPPSSVQQDDGEAQSSGARVITAHASDSAPAHQTPDEAAPHASNKPRPPSLSMGTLKAFPLPAPTRPLPSVPESARAPSAPPDHSAQSIVRTVGPGPKSPGIQAPSATEPDNSTIRPASKQLRSLEVRPATALGHIETSESTDADDGPRPATASSSHSQPVSPGPHPPKRRGANVRVPCMQELPESRSQKHENHDNLPLAESPVQGRASPTKRCEERTMRKRGLQIDPRIGVKNLPFGLPSPPPTANLPLDPPLQPAISRALGQRNCTAPTVTGVPGVRGLDLAFPSGSCRGSIGSRSNSSRSSVRRESIPEAYHDRPETPFPSSDDEGFGPGAETSRSRHNADNHQNTRTARCFPDPREARQDSVPCRPRYSSTVRPLTPQSRSTCSLEKTSSSQSLYSQSTYRSRDSQSSHRAPVPSLTPHYLEDRIANLERQNKILQAALLAALDFGVKNPNEDLQSDSGTPSAFPAAALTNHFPGRFASRPESCVSSSRSSEHSISEAASSFRDGRASTKQLDNMIEDIESGWLSDKSSLGGARVARKQH